MKRIPLVIALAAGAASFSCYAQTTPSPSPAPAQTVPAAQGGAWAPQYGVTVQPKTRAQVYQEMVHAEQNGQLQHLDRTLYWHG
ncbi:DUF4148 domain-containing protein [Caballeronia sp. LZ034LL]|uniref:DUF4148 domain-containing protein n=1 Tax=Caballeronia sp. LZ034LL TaxID=3038567 RepID=UPI0028585E37|nr:DUF4148 domain-containing protein [Caballeronia sp. LZ034LL]MDR5835127.1 DUF4148 domain-containing protein [Caballeronia sp. LZ034LL]